GGRHVVPVVARTSGARHGGDGTGGDVHLADALVESVPNVNIARAVHRHAFGIGEFCAGGRTIVPDRAQHSVARHGGDGAAGAHLADAVVKSGRDVEVARAVHCHAIGKEDFRGGGRDAVPVVAPSSGARHGGDVPAGVHLADAVVVLVRYVQVARAVHRHASGIVEFRAGGRHIVPVVARSSGARHGGDLSGGVHLTDALARLVRDVQVARAVHRHFVGGEELR